MIRNKQINEYKATSIEYEPNEYWAMLVLLVGQLAFQMQASPWVCRTNRVYLGIPNSDSNLRN